MERSKRINSTIPLDLLARMDAYQEKAGLTRSGLIVVAVRQYLDAQENLPTVMEALNTFTKLVGDVSKLSPGEVEEQLKENEEILKRISGAKDIGE